MEVDIYLPDLGLAFEFNGDYWHSDEFIIPNHGMTAEEYHDLKWSDCHDVGVHLYFIWESD